MSAKLNLRKRERHTAKAMQEGKVVRATCIEGRQAKGSEKLCTTCCGEESCAGHGAWAGSNSWSAPPEMIIPPNAHNARTKRSSFNFQRIAAAPKMI
ncbi:MAG: hypothetical protein ALAOOOJD_01887 [bacterium]|nr:hypothetical protein [bacterium]